MARINKTRYAILGCLSIKPMTAYDIKQFMERTTSHFWTEREGQLYPTLSDLVDESLIEYHEKEADKAGTKKVYFLTKQGMVELRQWLQKPVENQVYRNELLLKLFFGNTQGHKECIAMLQTRIPELQALLAQLTLIRDEHLKQLAKNRKIFVELTLDYGIQAIQMELNWCEHSIDRLNQKS